MKGAILGTALSDEVGVFLGPELNLAPFEGMSLGDSTDAALMVVAAWGGLSVEATLRKGLPEGATLDGCLGRFEFDSIGTMTGESDTVNRRGSLLGSVPSNKGW